MVHNKISDVQSGYDLVADEYARRIYDEFQHKPLDCQLLDRFSLTACETPALYAISDAAQDTLRVISTATESKSAEWTCQRGWLQCARRLNPGIQFNQGDMRSPPGQR